MKSLFLYSILLVSLLLVCAAAPMSGPRPTITPSTKTPLPRSTATPGRVALRACVTASSIKIRTGPGVEYKILGGMVSGTCMWILGRNEESDWVYMITDDSKLGWVAGWFLTIQGDLNRVSIRSASDVVSQMPTARVIPTSTRTPVVIATNTKQPVVIYITPRN